MMTALAEVEPMAIDREGDKFSGSQRRRATDRESVESQVEQLRSELRTLRDGLPDVDRLRFNWKQMAAVVGASLFIVGANWVANEPLRKTVGSIQTEQELQKATAESKAALAEERMITLRTKVDDLTKAVQLQQLKVDDLTNKVLDVMRRVR